MKISHVEIISFQTITNHSFWTFYIGGKAVVYIINRKMDGCFLMGAIFSINCLKNLRFDPLLIYKFNSHGN